MNEKFSIRRRIEIDAAHRVPDHKSKCFNIHGHRYVIEAELEGDVFEEGEQTGMVMDFGFIKQLMTTVIHDPCDHGIIFYELDPIYMELVDLMIRPNPEEAYPMLNRVFTKVHVVPMVPTAENLAKYWYDRMVTNVDVWFRYNCPDMKQKDYPTMKAIHVYETPNSVARYPA